MPRSGTLVICVQNLDFSGANQVVLNIVAGRTHESNVVVLSPKNGSFGARFVESGAAVRVGVLEDLLNGIRDVFCIICNTIMTANIVVEMANRPFPVIWILHEWWDDEQIKENLRIRNYQGLNLGTVKQAMAVASRVVCVCESQKQLYNPTAPTSVIFVGVPDPMERQVSQNASLLDFNPEEPTLDPFQLKEKSDVFTFLCLGIICPRKNQLWTVKLFKQFAKDKPDVKLKVVGARYTRVYEMEYLEKVREEAKGDPRIEIYDVTDNVDQFYKEADCLILTSLNEVTPMVISEALACSIPVISTNIAGIKEMYTDGVEGFHFAPEDEKKALASMEAIYQDPSLRKRMSIEARKRFETTFDLNIMVESYRQLVLKVAPPVILIDMDGTLVDWDRGFMSRWGSTCEVDRSKSYAMEECVPPEFKQQAIDLFHQEGFFLNLPWMEGALDALREMEAAGLQLFICTSPIKTSRYCAQEKLEWVANNLGESWLNKVILCQDKTTVAGDLLIDDKPFEFLAPGGKHTTATWRQVLFDAPYNRQMRLPRMLRWHDWRNIVYPMLGKLSNSQLLAMSQLHPVEASKKPFTGLPMPKLGRDSSISSVHSGLSVEEIQQQFDMMHFSDKPLTAEDAATIVSGSMSLMGDEFDLEEDQLEFLAEHEDDTSVSSEYLHELTEKKRQLQRKLELVNQTYRQAKERSERKMAMEADTSEMEGLQLFRPSYQKWKGQQHHVPKNRK